MAILEPIPHICMPLQQQNTTTPNMHNLDGGVMGSAREGARPLTAGTRFNLYQRRSVRDTDKRPRITGQAFA